MTLFNFYRVSISCRSLGILLELVCPLQQSTWCLCRVQRRSGFNQNCTKAADVESILGLAVQLIVSMTWRELPLVHTMTPQYAHSQQCWRSSALSELSTLSSNTFDELQRTAAQGPSCSSQAAIFSATAWSPDRYKYNLQLHLQPHMQPTKEGPPF